MLGETTEQEEHKGMVSSVANCCICYELVTNEIYMCPKCGNALFCKACKDMLGTEGRCPMCKQAVKSTEYVRDRVVEELLRR